MTSFRESLVSGRLLCLLMAQAVPADTDLRKFKRRGECRPLDLYLRCVQWRRGGGGCACGDAWVGGGGGFRLFAATPPPPPPPPPRARPDCSECQLIGITQLFTPEDLINATGTDKVVANVEALRRLVAMKAAYIAATSAAAATTATPVGKRVGAEDAAAEVAGAITTPPPDTYRRRSRTAGTVGGVLGPVAAASPLGAAFGAPSLRGAAARAGTGSAAVSPGSPASGGGGKASRRHRWVAKRGWVGGGWVGRRAGWAWR
jgi:hypothetical protein